MVEKSSYSYATSLELHYWLNDGSHTMNAMQFNRCEHELLCLLKEISTKLKLDADILIEPIQEGGIRSWFKFDNVSGNEIKVGIVLWLCTSVLGSPISTTTEYLTTRVLDSFFENPRIKELKEEKEIAELELSIAKAKKETTELLKGIDEHVISKRKSNFFESADKERKIDKVSFTAYDVNGNIVVNDEVPKCDFPKHILSTDELEPEEHEATIIEIVSPVSCPKKS